MRTWSDERLLRRDLTRRVLSAVEDGMSKAQAARTFSVSLSSVKRYVTTRLSGENP